MKLYKKAGRKKKVMSTDEWNERMRSNLVVFKEMSAKPGAVLLYEGIRIFPREIKTRLLKIVVPNSTLPDDLSAKYKHGLTDDNFAKYISKFELLQQVFPRVKISKKTYSVVM